MFSGEEKPFCVNCQRQGEQCDYSIRLNWEGRARKKSTTNSSSSVVGSTVFAVTGPPASGPNPVVTASEFVQVQPQQSQTERLQSATTHQLLPAKRQADNDNSHNNTGQGGDSWGNAPAQPSKDNQERMGMISPVFVSHSNRGPHALSSRNDFQIYPSPPAGVSKEESHPLLPMTLPMQSRVPSYPSPSSSVFTNASSPGPLNQTSLKGYPAASNPQQSISYIRQPPSPLARSYNNPIDPSTVFRDHSSKRIKLTSHNSFYGQRDVQALRPPAPPPSSYPNSSSSMPGDSKYTHGLNIKHNTTSNQNGVFSSAESSDSTSEDAYPQFQQNLPTENLPTPTEIQRVSVQSLLSHSAAKTGALADPLSADESTSSNGSTGDPFNYGFDCGRPDLDVYRNDDSTAIERNIPAECNTSMPTPVSTGGLDFDAATNTSSPDVNLQLRVTTVFAKGGYYGKPVPINIPRHLSPLPAALLDHPINLLYFHHFMNHTGRILVPHDCSKNPFANVLPASKLDDSFFFSFNFFYTCLINYSGHRGYQPLKPLTSLFCKSSCSTTGPCRTVQSNRSLDPSCISFLTPCTK